MAGKHDFVEGFGPRSEMQLDPILMPSDLLNPGLQSGRQMQLGNNAVDIGS